MVLTLLVFCFMICVCAPLVIGDLEPAKNGLIPHEPQYFLNARKETKKGTQKGVHWFCFLTTHVKIARKGPKGGPKANQKGGHLTSREQAKGGLCLW